MFVKLYEQVFNSSIMEESVETRYIWICLLALSDKEGIIDMTLPSIARRINISQDQVDKAITLFLQPDKKSRSKKKNGQRLEKIRDSFGWKIVNYEYYRNLRNQEERRNYMREYMKSKRKNTSRKPLPQNNVNNMLTACKQPLTMLANTEAEEEEDKKEIYKKKKSAGFIKPSLSQIKNYCTEKNNNIDPQEFYDYYESVGWTVGKKPMKDWKAAARTWALRKNRNTAENSRNWEKFLNGDSGSG